MPIWSWAESNIVLSVRQATGYPGPYRTALTPYVRGIFDALQDARVQSVTVEKGAQTGLTLAGYVWVCWGIASDPGPVLMVYPTIDLARSASETRVQPMIEDSPALKAEMGDGRDEWTKLQYRMRRCQVNWVGSNSPANLASRPVRYLFLDETDKYPIDNQQEGNAVALAIQRTKTFWNRKIFKVSTPTTHDGIIHKAYLAGDQRRFFVPCHACGGMQFLKWSQVRFDSKATPEVAAVGAHYECEFCKAHWTDGQKVDAVAKGEWRATAESQEDGSVSFHVSSLYAPWSKWRDLVAKFLHAKDYPNELQDFINSELGEPFERETLHVKEAVFSEREGEYERGQKFTDAPLYKSQYGEMESAVLVGVDVQKTHLVAVARLFTLNGDSGQVDRKLIGTFAELAEWSDSLKAYAVGVDCRYRTQEVYEYSLQYKFAPCLGMSFRVPGIWEQTSRNIYEGTRKQRSEYTVGIIQFDPNQLKDQLFDRLMGSGPFAWLLPRATAIDPEYCKQMMAEHSVDGKWIPIREGLPNHWWDAEVLTLLMATVHGFNRRYAPGMEGK
jgi:hypothetical protein